VKSTQFAAQLLEMIAGGNPQVPVSSGVVDHLELAENPTFQVRRDIPRADVIHEKRTQQSSRKLTIIPDLELS